MQARIIRACLALLIATPLASDGQTVRGIVSEQAGNPLAGVLMTLSLDNRPDSTVVSTLTNTLGAYSLRAPQPGRYRLGAKRIGVRRFESETIDLSAAQELGLDVVLERLAYRLPSVTVRSHPLCVRMLERLAARSQGETLGTVTAPQPCTSQEATGRIRLLA